MTSSSYDVTALSQTWTAAGGRLVHSPAVDTVDGRGQTVTLELYGLDQTIINQIQNNNFRGRIVRIYLLHWEPDTGVQDTPDLIFIGRQNGDFQVTEDRTPDSTGSGGTVTVMTQISSDMASIDTKVSTRCNVVSHEEMIRRSGVASPDDKFFQRVITLQNKDLWWGINAPSRAGVVGPDLLTKIGGGEGGVAW